MNLKLIFATQSFQSGSDGAKCCSKVKVGRNDKVLQRGNTQSAGVGTEVQQAVNAVRAYMTVVVMNLVSTLKA